MWVFEIPEISKYSFHLSLEFGFDVLRYILSCCSSYLASSPRGSLWLAALTVSDIFGSSENVLPSCLV
jgi:hypothetical protein